MIKDSNLWETITSQAIQSANAEPVLAAFLKNSVLDRSSISEALSFLLASKLNCKAAPVDVMQQKFLHAFQQDGVLENIQTDLFAVFKRDSACKQISTPFLYYKGFHGLQAWRAAHYLWHAQQKSFALLLQSRISMMFGIDIHPAATIGKGVMFDHATGIVIGETAVVGDCVSIMQSVTLGGTGKESGDRHPKIGRGVLIGPGAKVLGNITIGEGSKITAASVVLQSVKPHSLVAGVPATIVGQVQVDSPSELMDQGLNGCNGG